MSDNPRTDRLDGLVDRVVVGDARPSEWEALLARANEEPKVWREIVMSLRDQAMLGAVARRADRVATRIDAHDRPTSLRAGGRLPWSSISGWALAAILFLAWAISFRPHDNVTSPPAPGLVQTAGWSAQQAFDAYLEKGRAEGSVLSDAPRRVVVQTRPAPAGEGLEVIYVRQIMERAVVPDLYEYRGADEHGRPTLARYETAARSAM